MTENVNIEPEITAKKVFYGDYARQILLFVIPSVFFYGLMYTEVAVILPLLYSLPVYLLILFEFLFVSIQFFALAPLLYGIALYEYKSVNGIKRSLSDLFYPFNSFYLYMRSIKLFLSLFWRFILIFLAPVLIIYEMNIYTSGNSVLFRATIYNGFDVTYLSFCIITVMLILLAITAFARFLSYAYLTVMYENVPMSDCIRMAKMLNYGYNKLYFYKAMQYIPLLLFSFLTFGVLFFAYALPMLVLELFFIARKTCTQSRVNRLSASLYANNYFSQYNQYYLNQY